MQKKRRKFVNRKDTSLAVDKSCDGHVPGNVGLMWEEMKNESQHEDSEEVNGGALREERGRGRDKGIEGSQKWKQLFTCTCISLSLSLYSSLSHCPPSPLPPSPSPFPSLPHPSLPSPPISPAVVVDSHKPSSLPTAIVSPVSENQIQRLFKRITKPSSVKPTSTYRYSSRLSACYKILFDSTFSL